MGKGSLKWRFREHWSGEIATYQGFGLTLKVRDCDGDSSWWELRRGDEVIASGEDWDSDNFQTCLERAEAALWAEIKRREDAHGQG